MVWAEITQQIFAIATLIMGLLVIGVIFNAYRIVRQRTLLIFAYGLFTLVVGITFADLVSIFASDELIVWSGTFSRIVAFIGLCVMAHGVLRG